jgi:uncharacterized protein YaeQ
MAAGAVLYNVRADVSNIDAGVYETLSLRIAQHPSEDLLRVVARGLAYCLAYEPGLSFGKGLDDASEPALSLKDGTGRILHWIDVGHPDAERLHRASKATQRVTVFCHRGPAGLIRERDKRAIHKADQIGVWLLEPDMVKDASELLERSCSWSLVLTGQDLLLNVGEQSLTGLALQTTLALL